MVLISVFYALDKSPAKKVCTCPPQCQPDLTSVKGVWQEWEVGGGRLVLKIGGKWDFGMGAICYILSYK